MCTIHRTCFGDLDAKTLQKKNENVVMAYASRDVMIKQHLTQVWVLRSRRSAKPPETRLKRYKVIRIYERQPLGEEDPCLSRILLMMIDTTSNLW